MLLLIEVLKLPSSTYESNKIMETSRMNIAIRTTILKEDILQVPQDLLLDLLP